MWSELLSVEEEAKLRKSSQGGNVQLDYFFNKRVCKQVELALEAALKHEIVFMKPQVTTPCLLRGILCLMTFSAK